MSPPLPDPNIPIVVFDLDGTLAKSVWPQRREVGEPISEGVELLWFYAKRGYRIEILTARPEVDRDLIWSWVLEYGLPIDAVTCDKPFGGIYIDDRAWCPEYTQSQKRFWLDADDDGRAGAT